MFDFLKDLNASYSIGEKVNLFLKIVPWIMTFIGLAFLNIRKNWRFFRNLSRPIYFINLGDTKGKDFSLEKKLISDSGFFKMDKMNHSSIDVLRDGDMKKGLIVVGVESGSVKEWDDLLGVLSTQSCPSIIYTFGDSSALDKEVFQKVSQYSKIGVVNFPLRLVGDVFNILSVYPNEKRSTR